MFIPALTMIGVKAALRKLAIERVEGRMLSNEAKARAHEKLFPPKARKAMRDLEALKVRTCCEECKRR